MKGKIILIVMLFSLLLPTTSKAQDDDFGMQYSIGASKKVGKQWSFGAEAEMRTRNNSKTVSRWSGELSTQYKFTKWLKAGVSYKLMNDRREEKLNMSSINGQSVEYETDDIDNNLGDNSDVIYKNWRPSYFTLRHRVSASITGSFSLGRLNMSLRERWQYTYRPEKETDRYNFSDAEWKKTTVSSKAHHVLRSRFQLDYDIPKCKFDPYASIELFNSMNLEKTRLTAGVEYKLQKKHVFNVFYRYQNANSSNDDEDRNCHIVGLSYQFKF